MEEKDEDEDEGEEEEGEEETFLDRDFPPRKQAIWVCNNMEWRGRAREGRNHEMPFDFAARTGRFVSLAPLQIYALRTISLLQRRGKCRKHGFDTINLPLAHASCLVPTLARVSNLNQTTHIPHSLAYQKHKNCAFDFRPSPGAAPPLNHCIHDPKLQHQPNGEQIVLQALTSNSCPCPHSPST